MFSSIRINEENLYLTLPTRALFLLVRSKKCIKREDANLGRSYMQNTLQGQIQPQLQLSVSLMFSDGVF